MRSGQVLRDLLLEPAEHDRPHAAGEQRARGLRGAAVVLLEELAALRQVTGVDEFHDAPQIEQPVFQRRAGKGELVLGLERLGRSGDHRLGVLDVLRLVQDDGAEGEFLERSEVAAQQRVVGDNEIVLRNLLPQGVAMLARGEQQHLHAGDELLRLALPVEDDARGADDEAGRGAPFLAQVLHPRERLHGLAQAHVIGQQRAEAEARGVGEEVEAGLLVGAQLGAQTLGLRDFGNAGKIIHRVAQELERAAAVFGGQKRFELLPRARLRAGHLERAELLLLAADLHADLGQRGDGLGELRRFLAFQPGAVGQLDVGIVALLQPGPVGLGHGDGLVLPFGLDAEPVDAGRLDLELGEAAALAADEVLEALVREIVPGGAAVAPVLEQRRDCRRAGAPATSRSCRDGRKARPARPRSPSTRPAPRPRRHRRARRPRFPRPARNGRGATRRRFPRHRGRPFRAPRDGCSCPARRSGWLAAAFWSSRRRSIPRGASPRARRRGGGSAARRRRRAGNRTSACAGTGRRCIFTCCCRCG